jgi:uncharacterized protein (DUF1778 family)
MEGLMSISNHHDHVAIRVPRTKVERLEARVSVEQKDMFQHAANLLGRSLTDFMVSILMDASKQVISEHHNINLSVHDQKKFVHALLKVPSPNKNLLNAVKRHKKFVK